MWPREITSRSFIAALGGVAVGSVLLVAAITLWQGYRTAISDAETYTRNHAAIVEDHTRRFIAEFEFAIRPYDPLLVGSRGEARTEAAVRAIMANIANLSTQIVDVTFWPSKDQNGGAVLLLPGTSELPLGSGLRLGSEELRKLPAGDHEKVRLLRPVRDAAGISQGTLAISFRSSFFTDYYTIINIRSGSDLGIATATGGVIARASNLKGGPAPAMPAGPEQLLGSDPSTTIHETSSGKSRIASYQLVRGYAAAVFSTLDMAEVLAPWRRSLVMFVLIAITTTATVLILGYAVLRSQRNEKWLAQIVRSSSEAIWSYDRSGRIVSWNRSAQALLGFSAGEAQRMGNAALVPSARGHEIDSELKTTAAGRVFRAIDTARLSKGGAEVPVSVSASPIIEPDGRQIGVAVSAHDISDRKEADRRLHHLAYFDQLVGLPNRVMFEDHLSKVLASTGSKSAGIALHYLDIDHFKDINDNAGHLEGDRVLQVIAGRISKAIGENHRAFRLSGDEFGVVQDNVSQADDAAELARRLIGCLGEPVEINGHPFALGVSIGIAMCLPEQMQGMASAGEVASQLLRRADIAMYRAKGDGRARYHLFDRSMELEAQQRHEINQALQGAMASGELSLVYQPQYNLNTGLVVGVEALLRWNRTGHGPVSPALFIPEAERSGQIVVIGEWVLAEACAQLRRWDEAGMPPLRMAVNVSPVQLREGRRFFGALSDTLHRYDIDPRRLELEITEGVLIDPRHRVPRLLQRLRRFGITIAIDDFGTGYSALRYLKDMPIDRLKIDQSFIKDLPHDQNYGAIVRAIVAMAQKLGLDLIAEGVETPGQQSFLRKRGVSEAQGYLFSKPLDAADVYKLISMKVSA